MTMKEFIEKAKAAKAAQDAQDNTQVTRKAPQTFDADKFRSMIAKLKEQQNKQD